MYSVGPQSPCVCWIISPYDRESPDIYRNGACHRRKCMAARRSAITKIYGGRLRSSVRRAPHYGTDDLQNAHLIEKPNIEFPISEDGFRLRIEQRSQLWQRLLLWKCFSLTNLVSNSDKFLPAMRACRATKYVTEFDTLWRHEAGIKSVYAHSTMMVGSCFGTLTTFKSI